MGQASLPIGALAGNPIAIAPLSVVQRLAGLPDRVTQVLVQTAPGAVEATAQRLRAIADGRLDVAAADAELGLLDTTARPNDLATGLFAAISAMVGFLLAVNAMLLTAPERLRWVAELRTQGYSSWRNARRSPPIPADPETKETPALAGAS